LKSYLSQNNYSFLAIDVNKYQGRLQAPLLALAKTDLFVSEGL